MGSIQKNTSYTQGLKLKETYDQLTIKACMEVYLGGRKKPTSALILKQPGVIFYNFHITFCFFLRTGGSHERFNTARNTGNVKRSVSTHNLYGSQLFLLLEILT